ncbi:MAG: cytochrome b/b6 domain-containing protein [Bryobacterales bacterium]|nr:cytochrome b/b6 domain-containing protein [Bryobacterales bacterium]
MGLWAKRGVYLSILERIPGRSGGWAAAVAPLALLIFLSTFPARAQEAGADVCASCHEQGQKLKASIHAGLGCSGCHEKHEKYPHPANAPKPACTTCHSPQVRDYSMGVHGRAVKAGNQAAPDCSMCHGDVHQTASARTEAFRKAEPETCGMCHDKVVAEFKASVHGKAVERGVKDAPLCTNCHGEHSILPHKDVASSVSAAHVSETCARCHGDVRLSRKFGLPPDRITSFDSSFHGLASKSGSQTVANCASCHGVHGILASSDPKSMINARNLPATCGKCHPGAGSRFALGSIHLVQGAREPDLLRWARIFYLTLIPVTIGLMLLHHGGDWIRKLIYLRLKAQPVKAWRPMPPGPPEIRMFLAERLQHALLAVSFIVLVWTGFALKYPEQWWARPLVVWEGSWPVRGTIHRIAAAVMVAVTVLHALSLAASRRLREHWKTLLPVKADIYEGFAGLSYALGLRDKPVISAHSYVEKAEYWAVAWGTVVMGLTGVLLWANNWALKFLPKVWLDLATTIHFYEAVLAALSIVVWHFYSVIFDPDVYPLDPAFLTGVSVRTRESHPHAPAGKPTRGSGESA